MKTLKFLSVVLLAMMFSSCVSTSYYQIYKATPTDTTQLQDNLLVFEDENCQISYNLWDEGGNIGFRFYNKTNENIYLNLEESFFVFNGLAHNYFKNRVYTNSSGTGNNIVNSAYSITFNEEKIVCIPPKSTKFISEYSINKTLYRDCDLFKYPTKKRVKTKSFTIENSPFIFSNRITYSIGTSKNMIRLVNEFYISEITNYPEGELIEFKQEEFCGEKSGQSLMYINKTANDKFYIRYMKVDNAKH
jgi:hypothetical protein